jgi:hypothetical protein
VIPVSAYTNALKIKIVTEFLGNCKQGFGNGEFRLDTPGHSLPVKKPESFISETFAKVKKPPVFREVLKP